MDGFCCDMSFHLLAHAGNGTGDDVSVDRVVTAHRYDVGAHVPRRHAVRPHVSVGVGAHAYVPSRDGTLSQDELCILDGRT